MIKKITCYGCRKELLDIEGELNVKLQNITKQYSRPEILIVCNDCGNWFEKESSHKRETISFWGTASTPQMQHSKTDNIDQPFNQLLKDSGMI